jgi:hypothetical protein
MHLFMCICDEQGILHLIGVTTCILITHISVVPGREEVVSAVCIAAGANGIGACCGSLMNPKTFKVCLP